VEGRAKIIDKSSGEGATALRDVHMSHEDRHAYGEGLNRGGFLLCAEVDDEEDADKIVRVLEGTSSVDLDDRQEQWKSTGWQGAAGASASGIPSSAATTSHLGAKATNDQINMDRGTADHTGNISDRVIEEERIPIVEEELRIGKREVNRGGARVRSYIKETPVHEQVNLREEHVSVERRPVDRTLAGGDLGQDSDLLRDRTIEMTETAEEAVIDKEARVREELVVRKTAEEHTEAIDDTVRRTEVDVDEGLREGSDRPALFQNRSGDNREEPTSQSELGRTDYERTDRDRGI
jgi:uncharacterized protein (TIGR02271 family)